MPNPNEPNFVTDSSAPKGKAKDATVNPSGTTPGQTQVEFGHFEGPKSSQTKDGSDMKDMFTGRVPGAAPARDKVIYRNGIYMHIHPGYPKGATKESEQKYHPVSQKHRGEGGKDITQKLHVMAGLGANGMGGMTPTWRQAASAVTGFNRRDLGSKALSLVAALGVAGMNNVGDSIGAMFDLGKAMMSGNPMSIASKAIGGSLDVFTSVAEETVRLRDKYRIPSETDSEYVRQTILGRAFAGQQEAYNDGYRKSMEGSNAYISLAADMSIKDPSTGESLYKKYVGTDAMPTTAADLEDAMRKRDAFLMAAGYKVNGKNYEDAFAEGLANISDEAAVSMTDALYSRNNDYLKAMEELVVNDRAYKMDGKGFIDFSSPVAMTDAEKEKYKIALQVGNRLATEQLGSINSSIKTSVKQRRSDLTQTRAAMRAHAARIKAIEEARKEENIKNGGMHVKVAYDLGMNTEVDKEFNPITYTNLREGTKKLKAEIEANEKARKILESQGITSEADQKARGVYTRKEVKDAEDRLILWDDMAANLRAESLQRRNDAESRRLNQMDPVSRKKYKKKLGEDGLPMTENALNTYVGELSNDLAIWDSSHADADKKASEADLDAGMMDIARKVAAQPGVTATDKEIFDRLKNSPANGIMAKALRDHIRADKIANPSAKSDYISVSNELMKADAKRRIESLQLKGKNKALNMDRAQFSAGMDELRRQCDELVRGANAATGAGELYDSAKYDQVVDNINRMHSAVLNGNQFFVSNISTPAGHYDFVPGDAERSLVDMVTEAAKDREGDFYHGDDRIDDSSLMELFEGKTISGDKRHRIDSVLNTMSIGRMKADFNNAANRYLALIGTYPGGLYSFKTRGSREDEGSLASAIARETNAYDKYVSTRYGVDPSGAPDYNAIDEKDHVAFAMESHISYLANKMAVNEMMKNKGLSSLEREALEAHSRSLDDEAAKDMLNLSYDDKMKDFGYDRFRDKFAMADAVKSAKDMLDVNNADAVLQTYERKINSAMDRTKGFRNSVYDVARAIGANHTSLLSQTKLGLEDKDFGEFFEQGLGSSNRSDIAKKVRDQYGFDIDNGMDHLALQALKSVGIDSIGELLNMHSGSFRSAQKRMDKLLADYETTPGLNKDPDARLALVKSAIVAKNVLTAMESRQTMIDALLEGKLQWTGLDPDVNERLMDDSLKAFNLMFKTVKERSWTQGTISGALDNYSDIVEMDKESSDSLAGAAVLYGAAGVDPSLNQGTLDTVKEQELKDFLVNSAGNAKWLRENIIGSFDERVNAGEAIALTSSGAFGAWQMGRNTPDKMSMPVELYSVAAGLFGVKKNKGTGNVAGTVESIRSNQSKLDVKQWEMDNNWKGPKIVDLAPVMYKVRDPNTGEYSEDVHYVIVPIVETGHPARDHADAYRYVMTPEMNNMILTQTGNSDLFRDLFGIEELSNSTAATPQTSTNIHNATHLKMSASSPAPWSDDSIAKADESSGMYGGGYLTQGLGILSAAYKPDVIGGKILNNIPYPVGIKGDSIVVLVNGTKDAVVSTSMNSKYISRRYGVIKCKDTVQTLGGEQVFVTLPWEKVKITPPCLFFGLLDVFVPSEPDGFRDPRVVMEASRTSPDFDKAVDAVRIIRDFGGLYDSPSIDADQTARGIRNIIIRAYAEVGAFGGAVFDRMRSMAESLPPLNMENYFTVARAAFRLARSLDIYECRSREAWHLLKGLRSNALLAISANRFMEYRRRYASSRPEVDAIAYIGTDEGKGERELDVKDMLMLIGLMAACELKPLLPFIPRFYEDMDARWGDAADYWYIMMHHEPEPVPEPVPEVEEEASEESP